MHPPLAPIDEPVIAFQENMPFETEGDTHLRNKAYFIYFLFVCYCTFYILFFYIVTLFLSFSSFFAIRRHPLSSAQPFTVYDKKELSKKKEKEKHNFF